MAIRIIKNDNGIYTRDYYIIGQPVQTVGGVTQVAFAIPTNLNKGYLVHVNFSCSDNNLVVTNAFGGMVKAAFRRLGGNITQVGTQIKETFTGFSGGTPAMDIVANTINQTMDIRITGRAGVTLDWIIEFTVDYRTT